MGCICRWEGFPVRSAAPQAPQPSKGSSLPLPLCRQGCLSCLAALGREGQRRREAHTAAVESQLEEGCWAVDSHHGAESGDVQTKILCQGKEKE